MAGTEFVGTALNGWRRQERIREDKDVRMVGCLCFSFMSFLLALLLLILPKILGHSLTFAEDGELSSPSSSLSFRQCC